MMKIRLMPYREDLATIMHRQLPGHRLVSLDGRYEFCLDDSMEEADFWVVQGKGVRQSQTCRVAPENTILLTTEPQSVLVYPQRYIRQFGLVCSCQEQMRHRNLLLGPAILPWFVGFQSDGCGGYTFSQDYDSLSQPSDPSEKKRLISVITSNKAFSRGHLDRIKFVEKLREHLGDQIDVFGRGFRSFDDKWDVLRPYKYHIAIENSSQSYYWTEKIADSYLAECFPFYYGCTNLADYFPQDAFAPIDIHDPEKAIDTIKTVIESQRYEHSVKILAACKQSVLNEYNMFEYVARLCDQMDPHAHKQQVTIYPCRSGLSWGNFVNYSFRRNYYKLVTQFHYLKKGNSLQASQ